MAFKSNTEKFNAVADALRLLAGGVALDPKDRADFDALVTALDTKAEKGQEDEKA